MPCPPSAAQCGLRNDRSQSPLRGNPAWSEGTSLVPNPSGPWSESGAKFSQDSDQRHTERIVEWSDVREVDCQNDRAHTMSSLTSSVKVLDLSRTTTNPRRKSMCGPENKNKLAALVASESSKSMRRSMVELEEERLTDGRLKSLSVKPAGTLSKLARLTRGPSHGNYQNHCRNKHSFIIDPNSPFCKAWQTVTALLVIWIVWLSSFDIGFGTWWRPSTAMKSFSLFVDIYCVVDIMISFRTAIIEHGHIIRDPTKIAKHYLEFWFWIDSLASIPWEFLFGAMSKSDRKAVKFVKWLKLPRLLRLGRLRKLMKAEARYLPTAMLLVSTLLVMHLGACAWIYIIDCCPAYLEIEPFRDWTTLHEVQDDLVAVHPKLGWMCTQSQIPSIYAQALHVAAAMVFGVDKATLGGYFAAGGSSQAMDEEVSKWIRTMLDFDDGDPEGNMIRQARAELLLQRYPILGASAPDLVAKFHRQGVEEGLMMPNDINAWGLDYGMQLNLFGSIMLITGLLLQGGLIAHITKLVMCRHAAENDFRKQHDEIIRDMETFGHLLPEHVMDNITELYQFRWANQAFGPVTLLEDKVVSEPMRRELALCLYKNQVRRIDIFQDAPISVLEKVCLELTTSYVARHEIFFRKGTRPNGFYLLLVGEVCVTACDVWENPWRYFGARDEPDEGEDEDEFQTTPRYPQKDDMVMKQGDYFGLGCVVVSVLAQRNHTALPMHKKTAISMQVCQTITIPLQTLLECVRENPFYFQEMLDVASTAVGNTTFAEDSGNPDDEDDSSHISYDAPPPVESRLAALEKAVSLQGDQLHQLLVGVNKLLTQNETLLQHNNGEEAAAAAAKQRHPLAPT
eukprot:TRINITY_DN25448_c0_g1_i1.p1 TRINITY_DN25448_c0_g1~~TRINITY_DN25448_c0_g1_i1.p1  ORF type:complete len:849 (-),score=131.38 TRINITY_DN25448_c0_g1_i1:168-2714(-)